MPKSLPDRRGVLFKKWEGVLNNIAVSGDSDSCSDPQNCELFQNQLKMLLRKIHRSYSWPRRGQKAKQK